MVGMVAGVTILAFVALAAGGPAWPIAAAGTGRVIALVIPRSTLFAGVAAVLGVVT